MRKLDKLHAKKALDSAMNYDVLSFEREVEKSLPKGFLDQIIDANVESATRRFPHAGIDKQRQIAAFGMAGFQLGWLMCKETMKQQMREDIVL